MNKCIIYMILAMAFAGVPFRSDGASTYWINHKHKGLSRRCLVQIPDKLKSDADGNLSLILVFHGGGGNSRRVCRNLGFTDICDEKGVIVVYPEAYEGNWNDGRQSKLLWSQSNNVDDVGFVSFIIKKLRADFHISDSRIYGTGISNGGVFCHYLAINLPMTFAAIAPVIGGIAENIAIEAQPEFPTSVLMINGTKDPLVPFKGGGVGFRHKRGIVVGAVQSYSFWKNACGIKGQSYVSYLKDPVSGEKNVKVVSATGGRMNTDVVLYIMIGGGHVWPGNKVGRLMRGIVGQECMTFKGASVIYRFFEKHVRYNFPEKND